MRGRVQILVVIGVLAALLVGNVIVTHDMLTAPHPGHNDFLSRWEGARSYWRDGLNPYSAEASLNIQQRIFGRAATEDEDPGYFAYPFYTALLVWPLTLVSYAWASAIWMVLLEACLIAAVLLLMHLYGWRPSPPMLAALLVWSLTNYFAARGLILGQPALVVYLLQVVVLWALARQHDTLAGAALAFSTIKPQMVFLFVPLLLLWAWRVRRWRFVGGFVVVWGALMMVSFALLPGWLFDWIDQVRAYPSYTDIGSPVWVITRYYLGLGAVGEWIGNVLLWALVGWVWYGVLVRRQMARFAWAVMITLTITHLSALRTATPHFVIFTIPLMFYFAMIARRWRAGSAWIVLLLVILLVEPWAQFLLTVDGQFEHPSMYIPLSVTMLIVLWITRRQWWESGLFVLREE
jgi:hypothetical protein